MAGTLIDISQIGGGSPGGVVDLAHGGLNTAANTAATGKVPIGDGAGHFIEGDPIVSGPDAPGTPPTKNPVQMGLFDGVNVQRVVGSAAGRLSVDINTMPAVSATTNITQWNGNTVDTNSGSKSTGTLRVVLATDQPQLTNAMKVDGSAVTQPVSGTFWQATQPVSAASLPLPTGASTSAKQDTGNTSLASIDGKIPASPAQEHTTAGSPASVRLTDGAAFYKPTTPSDTQPVSGTFFQATQPVSAASLPLPTGASTESTLALIKAKTDNLDVLLSSRTKPADTQPISAASLPLPAGASTSAKQPALGTAGTPSADVISVQGIASGTPMAISGTVSVTSFANPLPVTGTFFQATQPISAVTLPLPTGAAQDSSLTTIDTDIKATQPRDVIDRAARLLGHATVDSSALPTNATQEAGGNLAALVTYNRNNAQVVDILNSILAQLKLLNVNFASCVPSAYVDQDSYMMDTLPTLN